MKKEQTTTRDTWLKIRVTPQEKEELKIKAKASGHEDVSSYIRRKTLYDTSPLPMNIVNLVEVNDALNTLYIFATSSNNDDIKECCETIFTHLNFPTGGML